MLPGLPGQERVRVGLCVREPPECNEAGRGEDYQQNGLGNDEWWFTLRRRKLMEHWQLVESLHYPDEGIQVESNRRSDDVGSTPPPSRLRPFKAKTAGTSTMSERTPIT